MNTTRFFQISILASAIVLVSFVPVPKKKPAPKKTAKQQPKVVVKDSVRNPYYIIVDKSEYELYVYDDEAQCIVKKQINYTPGLYKIIDEILQVKESAIQKC